MTKEQQNLSHEAQEIIRAKADYLKLHPKDVEFFISLDEFEELTNLDSKKFSSELITEGIESIIFRTRLKYVEHFRISWKEGTTKVFKNIQGQNEREISQDAKNGIITLFEEFIEEYSDDIKKVLKKAP